MKDKVLLRTIQGAGWPISPRVNVGLTYGPPCNKLKAIDNQSKPHKIS